MAPQRREQRAGVLLAREPEQAPSRQAARLEDVSGSIQQADDADVRVSVRRGDLIRERAAHAAEAEQHDVRPRLGDRLPSADLRELKRGMDLLRRLADHERDVALR